MSLDAAWKRERTARDRGDLLDATRWGSELEYKQILLLSEYLEFFVAPNGSEIFREGQPGTYLGIIASGTVKIFKADEQGKNKEVTALSMGNAFGEMALIDGGSRSATAQAVGEVSLLVLSKENFSLLIKKAPQLAVHVVIKIARGLSHRLRRTSGLLVDYLQD